MGVWLRPGVAMGEQEAFVPEQGAQHLRNIGGTKNVVDMAILEPYLPEQRETDETLDEEPHNEEILRVLNKMKESAAGDDEITSNTLRMMTRESPRFKEALCSEIKHLWNIDPELWEEEIQRGVVFLLWKQKPPKSNLDNYRGICLLSTISRLLAKIVASRLTPWIEKQHHAKHGVRFQTLQEYERRRPLGACAVGKRHSTMDGGQGPNSNAPFRHQEGVPECAETAALDAYENTVSQTK